MEKYQIEAENFDLELTLTCGQTFCWNRINGDLYGDGPEKFYTFRKGEPMIVEQINDTIVVETDLPEREVRSALSLNHELDEIYATFPSDSKLEKAKSELEGLRLIQDESVRCLIS